MKIYFDESGQSGCVLQRDDLTALRKSNVIVTDSENRQTSNWIIKKK